MDTYAEQIVKKILTGKDIMMKILIAAASLLLSVAAIIFFMPIGILAAFSICYFGYYLFTGYDVEYEYVVTNGEIDIDKIIAKRKRKRLLTVKASTFDKFIKNEDNNIPFTKNCITTFMVSNGENEYYAYFNHSVYGKSRLVFSPDERFIECLKPYISRSIL